MNKHKHIFKRFCQKIGIKAIKVFNLEKQFNNPKDVVAASPVQNGNKVPIPTDLNFSVPIE